MDSTETILYKEYGFDNRKYYKLQKQGIVDRINMFAFGRLYLEIGGKFLHDPHAARVLPGFDPEIKKKIFADFVNEAEIIFCINAGDIITDRQLKNTKTSYKTGVLEQLSEIEAALGIRCKISINKCAHTYQLPVEEFKQMLTEKGYTVYKRYMIKDYPKDINLILSSEGYGKDEYIKLEKKLILVTGVASNSGKLSTCLGQVFLDTQRGLQSGYAKYELFPIWNLPLKHPVNLAYEAATADVGDFNLEDQDYYDAYNNTAVTYNRDHDAYDIVKAIGSKYVMSINPMKNYKCPTDMGINMAGLAITDDLIVCDAALQELRRRKLWYQEILNRGDGKLNWVNRCTQLENEAITYLKAKYPKEVF